MQDPGRQQMRLGRKTCTWTSPNAQVITEEQGKALAEELGMQYIETSAKSNTNVDEAFFKLAQQVKDHLVDQGITSNVPGSSGTQRLNSTSNTQSKGGCC